MTWTVVDTKTGRAIRSVNGERPDEYPPEQSALVEAGEQGWELVGVAGVGTKPEQVLYFKRPMAED